MSRILIIYSTTDGQTLRISSQLERLADDRGHQVSLVSIDDVNSIDLDAFDLLLVGASIRYGKHNKKVYDFVRRNRGALQSRRNAFFSVNAVARKANRNTPQTNPYLKRFLQQVEWQPVHTAVFAGRIDYPRYNRVDRNIIRLIMWLTNGPTAPDACVEFTDWSAVEAFASEVFQP